MFSKVGITNNPENTRKYSKINFNNFRNWQIIEGPFNVKEEALKAIDKLSPSDRTYINEVDNLSDKQLSQWYVYGFNFGKTDQATI